MALKVGLALGSGAARGWAHIGVIRAMQKYGIEPDIVCGCSIGAIVGAAYAASSLDRLEAWVTSLTKLELAKYAEISFRSGLIDKARLGEGFVNNICDESCSIEDLDKAFGTVATDLHSGREVWFTKGNTLTAIWASISLPGLFAPVRFEDKWLVDGGLVNPVPVSMCRSLGADVVIAVDLNADIVGKHSRKPSEADEAKQSLKSAQNTGNTESEGTLSSWRDTLVDYSSQLFPNRQTEQAPEVPGMFETIAGSVNIMQDRITRSRMAGDPPDVLLSPRLAHISLLEFYRAEESIQIGYDLTLQHLEQIRRAINK
ncbi:MAG: patatin-like phospholipase RssA [Leucothrix sp.]